MAGNASLTQETNSCFDSKHTTIDHNNIVTVALTISRLNLYVLLLLLLVLLLLLHLTYSYLQKKMDLPDLNFTPHAEDVDEMDEDAENEMEGHVGDEMEEDAGKGMEGYEIVQNLGTVIVDHSIISSLDHSITSSLDHFI